MSEQARLGLAVLIGLALAAGLIATRHEARLDLIERVEPRP